MSDLNEKIKEGCEAIPVLFDLCKSDELMEVIIDIQNAVRNGR